jgi:hypothetical protein
MYVIPAFERLRHEDNEFEVSLGWVALSKKGRKEESEGGK